MSNNGGTILGLLAGGAIGAALGLLFAPDKGSNTRKKVLDEALLAKQKLSETVNELKDKIESETHFKKETLEEQFGSILTNASYKADDIISSLEKKLALLKERNKEFQKETIENKTINEEPVG
ncbi:YtxH domain-containing protein [uncultured Algibacter sp.]|uniref:YtxH domain-containing protein n=1 Tax=uncultured Algibacter sp. TaxID=298659 RepID=UPI002635E007|nr:YtxH domain-containing protein [uncultured Algibacter sp.]